MSTETETLREQLHLERVQRAEQDVERELITRGASPDDAKLHALRNRDRIRIDDNGEITTHTRRGGVFSGVQAVPQLARAIHMDLLRDLPIDPVADAAMLDRKRAGMRGII